MKKISHYVSHIQNQPHHIRKHIAFATASVCTAVIALVWLVGSVSSGVFALQNVSFPENTKAGVSAVTRGVVPSGVAGAAAALESVKDEAPAYIEIIDAKSSAPVTQVEQTVLPF